MSRSEECMVYSDDGANRRIPSGDRPPLEIFATWKEKKENPQVA
jgi:hypothetical protein